MGTRSKYQSYLLLAVALINVLFGAGLMVAGSILQSTLDQRADGVTELMFPLLRAQAVGVLALGFLLLFLSGVAFLCVSEGTRGLYTVLAGWSLCTIVLQVPPFLAYQMARASVYLALRANWLAYLQATFVDVYTGATYSVDQNSPPYLWNRLMAYYSCCGVSASTSTQNAYDYQYARWWKGSSYVATYMSNGTGVGVAETIPIWCCRMKSTAAFPTPALNDPTCLTNPTASNTYLSTDCGTALLSSSGVNEFAWHISLSFLWALAAIQPAWMFGIAIFALTCGTTRGVCVRLVRRRKQSKQKQQPKDSGSEDDGDVSEEEQLLRDKKAAKDDGGGSEWNAEPVLSYMPRRPPQSQALTPRPFEPALPDVNELAARRTVAM